MTWVRIDDRMAEHPKVQAAGPLAELMQFRALEYCNRNLTDGFVPWAVARTLVQWQFLGPLDEQGRRSIYKVALTSGYRGEDSEDYVEMLITLLVETRMWEVVDGGYRIHDYEGYQPSKAEVLADRERNAERQARYKHRHAVTNGVTNGVTHASDNASVTDPPVPVPVPVPGPKRTKDEDTPSAEGGTARAVRPRKAAISNRSAQVIDALRALGCDDPLDARDHAAIKGSSAAPACIAAAYTALKAGTWGDAFMQQRLSVRVAVEHINAYRAQEAAATQAKPARTYVMQTGEDAGFVVAWHNPLAVAERATLEEPSHA